MRAFDWIIMLPNQRDGEAQITSQGPEVSCEKVTPLRDGSWLASSRSE